MKSYFLERYYYIAGRPDPTPHAVEELRKAICDLRCKGLITEDQDGRREDEAVRLLQLAFAEFHYLTAEVTSRENRTEMKRSLVGLKKALERLASASEELQRQIGTPGYSAMSVSVLRILDEVHAERYGQPSGEVSIEGTDDPLWWDSTGQGAGLQMSEHWSKSALEIVNGGLSKLKAKGVSSGSPSAIFVENALAAWRVLDASEQTGRMPTVGTLGTWFAAAFKLVGAPLKGDPDGTAKLVHARLVKEDRAAKGAPHL